MPTKITASQLNATSADIMNVIRMNANREYQDSVPPITDEKTRLAVGAVLEGNPGLSNQALNALVNRICLEVIRSAYFNNRYKMLKKGMITYGEIVEEIFINIAKNQNFDKEQAAAREFKRNVPDVRTAFHIMNWNALYQITGDDADLAKALKSESGVLDLVAKIVESLLQGAEYDEYLLFKYMLIKAVNTSKLAKTKVQDDTKDVAIALRGASNALEFMSSKYNAAGVLTTTPKENQVIFMDAQFDAKFDVEVLASAFNMSKADFLARRFLIDDFTTFDNERFAEIREKSDMIEEVTPEELENMKGVRAILLDENWFQVYDNLFNMKSTPVNAGDYVNYFLHVQKTVSWSPFSNAIVFTTTDTSAPATITGTVTAVQTAGETTIITIETPEENVQHIQIEEAATAGIAIQRYGVYIFPAEGSITPEIALPDGTHYTAATPLTQAAELKSTITFTKSE